MSKRASIPTITLQKVTALAREIPLKMENISLNKKIRHDCKSREIKNDLRNDLPAMLGDLVVLVYSKSSTTKVTETGSKNIVIDIKMILRDNQAIISVLVLNG